MNTPAEHPIGGESTPKPVRKKHTYTPYSKREKLLPSLLLALFAPFTVLFFGPFEIYGNNADEFLFVLGDFGSFCLLFAFLAAALLFALFMLLPSRAFDIVFGFFLGLSLMIFLQGNYLSIGVNSLTGDGVGNGAVSTLKLVINLIIWIALIGGCMAAMLLLNKFKDTVRLVSVIALIALVGMTLISFAVVSFTTDVYATEKQNPADNTDSVDQVLTLKNLDTLATENNIVVFLVDRFDYEYYYSAVESCPEIFNELEGFTYFDDYVTLYPRTFPAIPYLLTAQEPDFTLPREEYFRTAYHSNDYMKALQAAGYDINLYTDTYYGYADARYMSAYTQNTSGQVDYKIVRQGRLSLDMIRLSLYRYLPFALQGIVGNISTPTFSQYTEYESEYGKYESDMKLVYQTLTDDAFRFRDSESGFSFIHLAGCHLPNRYDENFESPSSEERSSTLVAMKQSFKIIEAYIREMKRLGVYEQSTILIMGDHASIGSDTAVPSYAHITALLAKPAGVSQGEITTSAAPITQSDIFATVLAAAGAENAADYGQTIFDIDENAARTRRYLFHRRHSYGYECVEFAINGNSHDFDNWKIVNRYELGKSIYD